MLRWFECVHLCVMGYSWGRGQIFGSSSSGLSHMLKVVCPLRSIFGFDKEQQWGPKEQEGASPDTQGRAEARPRMGRQEPVLPPLLCTCPAVGPRCCLDLFPTLCRRLLGWLSAEGLASLDSVLCSARCLQGSINVYWLNE